MFRSLRSRLFIVYLGLILVGFGGLTLWAGAMMARATYDDAGNSLRIVTVSLANQLTESLEDGDRNVNAAAQSSATSLNAEVSIFNREGQLLGSSANAADEIFVTDSYVRMQNGAGQPFIVTNATILYEGRALGTVQIELPADNAQQAVRDRWLGLGAIFLAFTIMGVLVSSWFLTSLTQPLSNLQRTALAMAGGDLSQRVPAGSQDEIGAVSVAFNQMAERVEGMVAEQKAFAGNAAHELRTPLTTIRLRSEALQAGILDEASTEQYIREIDSQATHMGKLVEDLMALSRADTGRLEVGQEPIDVSRLIQRLIKEMEPRLAAKQLTISSTLPEATLLVPGHLNHLHVVYRNVLDNAVKYTPAGGKIQLTLNQVGANARLVIQDDGRGVSAEDLPNIGKRFFRADKAHSREIPGTGLGLALAISILAQYKGELTVSSQGLNKGTTVVVDWPI